MTELHKPVHPHTHAHSFFLFVSKLLLHIRSMSSLSTISVYSIFLNVYSCVRGSMSFIMCMCVLTSFSLCAFPYFLSPIFAPNFICFLVSFLMCCQHVLHDYQTRIIYYVVDIVYQQSFVVYYYIEILETLFVRVLRIRINIRVTTSHIHPSTHVLLQ